eukprot:jgi/Botrbrau1/4727/Bobra.0218s0039.1
MNIWPYGVPYGAHTCMAMVSLSQIFKFSDFEVFGHFEFGNSLLMIMVATICRVYYVWILYRAIVATYVHAWKTRRASCAPLLGYASIEYRLEFQVLLREWRLGTARQGGHNNCFDLLYTYEAVVKVLQVQDVRWHVDAQAITLEMAQIFRDTNVPTANYGQFQAL